MGKKEMKDILSSPKRKKSSSKRSKDSSISPKRFTGEDMTPKKSDSTKSSNLEKKRKNEFSSENERKSKRKKLDNKKIDNASTDIDDLLGESPIKTKKEDVKNEKVVEKTSEKKENGGSGSK